MDTPIAVANNGTYPDQSDLAASSNRRHWGVLIILLVGIVAIFSNIYATQPILPLISRAFTVTPATSSLSLSVVIFGLGIAALIYGPLSDRIGRKTVIIATSIALIIPTGLAALAPNFTVFLICRTAQGLLIPGVTVVGLAYLQEEFPPAMRGIITSAYVSSTAFGGLIGRLQGGFLADLFGWRWAFASYVLPVALACLLMAWRLPPTPPRLVTNTAPWWSVYAELGGFFRQRFVMAGAIIGCTMFFAFLSIFTFLPYHVEQPPYSLSTSATSLLYLVYLIGAIVTPFTGRLSDRIGRRRVLLLSLLAMLGGIGLVALPSLISIIVGLLILNIGLLASHAAASAFVSDHAIGGRGSATAFYLVWYYLGGTLGPPVTGLAWEHFGWYGVLLPCTIACGIAVTTLATVGRAK